MPDIAPNKSFWRLLSRAFTDFCGVINGFAVGKLSDSSFAFC